MPIFRLSSSSAWSALPLYSSASNCALQRVALELLVQLGRGDRLALLRLDLLRHALERLEGALVAHPGHRLLDALLRLGPLGPRDEDVLLALRLLDLVVELPQRALELLGLGAVLHPGLVQLLGALQRLVVARAAPAWRGRRGPPAPPASRGAPSPPPACCSASASACSFFSSAIARGHLLLRLGQLRLHVDDQLVQHLLRVLGLADQVVDVGPEHRRDTIPDAHATQASRKGASAVKCEASASVMESKLASNSL